MSGFIRIKGYPETQIPFELPEVMNSSAEEFLPYVGYNGLKYHEGDHVERDANEQVDLSRFLDEGLRGHNMPALYTKATTLQLSFAVEKGCYKSKDEDGWVTIKVSDSNVTIKNPTQNPIRTKYRSSFTVDLEIDSTEDLIFYIDFFASDNAQDILKGEYIEGDLKNVHCGRMRVNFKHCICNDKDWTLLSPMVSNKEKIEYGGDAEITWTTADLECYHYALHQMRVLGYWIKSERWNKKWDGTKAVNDDIFQLYINEDIAGMTRGAQEDAFKAAMKYLKEAMTEGTPVMVGLDYHDGYANEDMTTDHFAVIVGTGKENGRIYFDICDNAFENARYYCDCEHHRIVKTIEKDPSSNDSIVLKRPWMISQVRVSKKLNE